MVRNSKRWLTMMLVAAISIPVLVVPNENPKAEMVLQSPVAANVEEESEDVAESGDYLISIKENADILEVLENDNEIVSGNEEIVYEADLSHSELEELRQFDNIQIEENFFLEGASTRKDKKKRKQQLEERLNVRKSYLENRASQESIEWNYQMIHANEEQGDSNRPVHVAVLDSGIELLSGIPVNEAINFVEEESDLPYYMNDMTGHGTGVADIIHQICPQAQLYAVRVLDRENRGRLSDVVEGIYWCIEHDIDIINMSFGTSKNSIILQEAIQAAEEAGIMMIGSVGNGGVESSVEYPAAYNQVIAVGAVDTHAQRTEESAVGMEVELTAPGEQILTKSMFGLETVSSGTSMAAPHVTGAAASLMQQNVDKDATQIRMILDASGNALGNSEEYGYGLVDLEYAKELSTEDEEKIAELCNSKACMDQYAELQRDREVPVYEEIDYVEGRWKGTTHKELIDANTKLYGEFNATEIKLLKGGAVYPDDKNSGMQGAAAYPEWHGYYTKNYIANYIFATKIAKAAGDTNGLKKVNGQTYECFDRMRKAISKSEINNISWNTIIKNFTGLNYNAQDASTKKKWRRLFLYGMAAHTGADVYAHSSYYQDKSTGQMIRLDHNSNNWADAKDKFRSRYEAADGFTWGMIQVCYMNEVGDIMDFNACEVEKDTKICYGGIYNYALQANELWSKKDIMDAFKAFDCPAI